jgi:hypothetical protein
MMPTGLTRLAGVLVGACAVTTIGCSDSPPTPAQGASHVVLQPSATTACPVSARNNWSIPDGSLTNSTTVGSQIVDGSGGATVSCSVTASGGGFSVSGQLAVGSLSFSVQGTLSPGSGSNAFQGTGSVSQYSGDILMTLKGSDCTLTASEAQGAQIGPGKIWADFNCPTFNPTSAATGGCAANGTFVFGNCSD